jgi:hypothetical protein
MGKMGKKMAVLRGILSFFVVGWKWTREKG